MVGIRPGLPFGLASVVVHVGLMGALSEPEGARPPTQVRRAANEVPVEVTLVASEAEQRRSERPQEVEVSPGAARARGNVDRAGVGAAGGDELSREPVILLLPDAAPVTLLDTFMNNTEVNQTQRIHTARERATQEQRRATPHPDHDVFVASGSGDVAERRPVSRVVPAAGAPKRRRVPRAQRRDRAPIDADGLREHRGRRAARVAAGIHRGAGRLHQQSAAVQLARPSVDRGPAATRAESRHARVRDDVDAELLSAEPQRSWVEASAAAAERSGAGRGGARALGEPGFGSAHGRSGSQATPHRPGPGADGVLDTRDARYIRWFHRQRERVARRVVFPLERALAKDQGTSIYRVELRRDGRLRRLPSLVRSSGYGDFDRAAREAIQAALPFAPLPDTLAPDRETVAILIPIEFFNPMVQ